MGLHFSRLALAVALSMQLVAPLHAAEQLDEFYIEIKGPDKAAPTPLVPEMSQPAVAPAPVKSQAQPAPVPTKPKVKRHRSTMKVGVPQPFVNSAPVDNGPSAGVYGPVKSSDTMWSIAKQARPSNQVSVAQTLLAIYRKNPQAFAGGRVSGLYKGARLNLPTLAQVRVESEAQAQQLIRSGSLKLTAPKSVKPAANTEAAAVVAEAPVTQTPVTDAPVAVPEPTVTEKPSRVIKLSPPAVSAAAEVQPQEVVKPVVKLTPSNPGIAATEPAPVSVSAASTTSAAGAAASEDVVSNKLVIPSQPLTGVDTSISVLAATSASGGMPTSDPSWQQAYQGKIEALAQANGQLASQVNQLTQDVAQLKTLLANKASAALTSASAAVGITPAAEESEPATQQDEGFWSQLVSTPLNLGLMLLLPFLLALALVSLWLMARSKRDQAARELEDAESAELMMAHGDSHFDHLLAADMVAMPDLPDLEQLDETVQPQPEIVLSERKEPAFTIPSSFALNETPKTTSTVDPELVPELSELDLDLSVPTQAVPSEAEWPRELNEPLDESEFLSELGVSETQSEPVIAEVSSVASKPLEPEAVAPVIEPFTPREEVKLSNDELDALFDSVNELETEPFASMDSPDTGASELEAEEAEVEDVSIAASLDELNKALEPQGAESSGRDEAPVADWYNEEPVVDLSAPVAADDIDALLAQAAPAAKPAFKGIEELLAEADESGEKDEPYQGLSLDVGLDEFPEVLPDSDGVDVDLDSELGAKLDLARAYLEIDDKSSAIELLHEVLAAGSSVQKDEAQRLLKRLA